MVGRICKPYMYIITYTCCWGKNLSAEVQLQLEIEFLSLYCKQRNAVENWWCLEESDDRFLFSKHMNVTVITMNWMIYSVVTCKVIDHQHSSGPWLQIMDSDNFINTVKNYYVQGYMDTVRYRYFSECGRCNGLLVGALIFRSSGPGSSPDRGHCCVLWQDTLTVPSL